MCSGSNTSTRKQKKEGETPKVVRKCRTGRKKREKPTIPRGEIHDY